MNKESKVLVKVDNLMQFRRLIRAARANRGPEAGV